jgi:uncharacterized membrane protein (DUF373 family)
MENQAHAPELKKKLFAQMNIKAAYDRFEHFVAKGLTFLISVIVIVAFFRLSWDVFELLLLKSFDPLEHNVFQSIFGGIMTLLIAMEFKHSILVASKRDQNIIQVKTVLLIALLAVSRKFIILDLSAISAAKIASLAGALFALGCVYWLVRYQRQHRSEDRQSNSGF